MLYIYSYLYLRQSRQRGAIKPLIIPAVVVAVDLRRLSPARPMGARIQIEQVDVADRAHPASWVAGQ